MGTEMKVGALAKRTGMTVRTLHHYDEIGLLKPGGRTSSGHRLYGEGEVRRLQQIASLRHLGMPLDEIQACLDRSDFTLAGALELQIERIEADIREQARLAELVRHLQDRLASQEGASFDDLTRTIEATMNYEKYYTAEQLEKLRKRADEVGSERIEQVQQEWTDLFAAYGRAMEQGLDPKGPEVLELARKSASLIEEFTGGDEGIQDSLSNMYRAEGGENVLGGHGFEMQSGLWEYMGRATSALADSE